MDRLLQNDTKEVYKLFLLEKQVFPHIRYDYLVRCINVGNNICIKKENEVLGVLIYKKYKKNTLYANKGDYVISQIVAKIKGIGIGTKLFNGLEKIAANDNAKTITLSVRADNKYARTRSITR